MKIYDITLPITPEMVVWPGEPKVEVEALSRISQGASSNVSLLKMPSHVGTHIDPPLHFVEGGTTVDELPLESLIGECQVCDVGDVPAIDIPVLESAKIQAGITRVLFKTRNRLFKSLREFRTDYTYIDPEAAKWLIDKGMRLVGIDYLSVEKYKTPGHPTHMTLLSAGVVVAEGLDLDKVPAGNYTLVCLPLRIAKGDGSPARALLIANE